MRRTFALFAVIGAVACASAPLPKSITALDELAHSPRGSEAEQLAPQAFQHARELATQARAAHDAGDTELAELLSEQSRAQFEQAFALARAAKADTRLQAAKKTVDESRTALAAIDAQQTELTAEAEALELRARVVRDALPLATSGRATAEREGARRDAARSLLTDARLLCVAVQLLGGEAEAAKKQLETVGVLERKIDTRSGLTPIDESVQLRSACLSLLSATRRGNEERTSDTAQRPLPVDALLDELSRAGYEPQRDDRGVVVSLRDAFAGKAVGTAAQGRLGELARVAQAHAGYPLLLVLHSARSGSEASDRERLQAAEQSLRSAGASSVRGELVGATQPLVPPGHRDAASENARLEVVFIAPTW